MSRSYKKVPIIKDRNPYCKKCANKKVRKEEIDDGSNYKKVYESYNICDYKFSLYNHIKIDGIPIYYWNSKKMTIEEINEYWRK